VLAQLQPQQQAEKRQRISLAPQWAWARAVNCSGAKPREIGSVVAASWGVGLIRKRSPAGLLVFCGVTLGRSAAAAPRRARTGEGKARGCSSVIVLVIRKL